LIDRSSRPAGRVCRERTSILFPIFSRLVVEQLSIFAFFSAQNFYLYKIVQKHRVSCLLTLHRFSSYANLALNLKKYPKTQHQFQLTLRVFLFVHECGLAIFSARTLNFTLNLKKFQKTLRLFDEYFCFSYLQFVSFSRCCLHFESRCCCLVVVIEENSCRFGETAPARICSRERPLNLR